MFLKVEFNTGSGFFAAFYKTNLHNFQKFPSRLGLGFIEMHAHKLSEFGRPKKKSKPTFKYIKSNDFTCKVQAAKL